MKILCKLFQEQYSSVKNKFEHLSEEMEKTDKEKRALVEAELPPTLGADNVAERKTVFEKMKEQSPAVEERKQIEIERSEADRKRVKETFFEVITVEIYFSEFGNQGAHFPFSAFGQRGTPRMRRVRKNGLFRGEIASRETGVP